MSAKISDNSTLEQSYQTLHPMETNNALAILGEAKKILDQLGVVFFLITMVMDYTKNIKMELLETAATLGATRRQLISTVIIPAVLPDIIVSMRQMLAVTWTYLVIAEIVASTTGIGAMMMRARRFLHTDEIMAGIMVIGILGLLFDVLFLFFLVVEITFISVTELKIVQIVTHKQRAVNGSFDTPT